MALLRQQQAQAEAQLAEKDNLVATLKHTTESLEAMKSEAERVKQQLAEKIAEQEKGKSDLHSQLSLTESQKSELERQAAEQAAAVEELKAHLNHVNRDLGNAARDALEKSARLKELEQHEVIMAQALEDAKKQTDEERQRALELKIQMESQLAEIESTSRNLLDDLAKTKQEKEELHKTVEMQSMTLSELRRHLAAVQADLERANADQVRKTQELEEVKQKTESDRALIENLKEQSRVEELKRRELHNIIQEIKGNIRVYIRIRPSLKAEEANDIRVYERVIGSDDRGLQVTGGEEESATGKGSITKKWNFEFDRVFFPDNSQETIFKEISQLVQSALDGYKVCIFAYGQTGSGKTFTMEGPPAPCSETDRGMIPRSVEQIFSYAGEMRKKGWEYKFSVSFLEIYLQTIRDLLQAESEDVSENKHEIRMVKKGKENVTEVAGLNVVDVTSAEELVPLLKQANSQRATSATASNSRSSRSHSVFTLRISGVHRESGQQSEGVLNLIDLAGSERIAKSEVTGIRLEEAKAINTSLTCLGDVIAALAQGAKHVPFRNSKLTYLLQDCFGGGSKTLMFINIAPESRHMPESLCSLRFGAKVYLFFFFCALLDRI
jgi:kinesin family protein C1